MIWTIFSHTPGWVWLVLIGLIALGIAQSRPRRITRARAMLVPALMVALSLGGVTGSFGRSPLALSAWAAGFVLVWLFAKPLMAVSGARWCAAENRYYIPGSWRPLALIVCLFLAKYLVGASIAVSSGLARDPAFMTIASAVYGIFAGLFWSRAWSLRDLSTGVGTQPQQLGA